MTAVLRPPGARLFSVMLATALPSSARGLSLATSTHKPPHVELRDDGRVFVSGRPLRLSASAVAAWRQCPLLFKRRYIEQVPEPVTEAMTAGILVHESLADLYERAPETRTLESLKSHFRAAWGRIRLTPKYRPLFFPADEGTPRNQEDEARERAWGLKAFRAFETYLKMEEPERLQPLACEERVLHTLDDALGLDVVGVIDRLDDAASGEEGGGGGTGTGTGLVITDYKTGKSPSTKYSPRVNARIQQEAFFQLQVYALLLRETGRTPYELRLLFLGDGVTLAQQATAEGMDEAERVLRETWQQIVAALREDTRNSQAFPPLTGPLCGWCAHQDTCPSFAPSEAAAADGDAPPKAR